MASSTQLRDYAIAEGHLDDFVAAWLNGVVPLRRQFGFTVEAAWTIPDESRFIWVISYDGDGTFDERNAEYYASADRKAVNPDPAQWIAAAKEWTIERIDLD